ncbi:OmpA family protein [Actinocorallia libanotica]|uniref:OmpA-like domain-containing protein n=1 Tax=Actinocorallia libanotica TaxID=46162 RepID=A0ABN1RUP1_9ACTN
MKRFLPFRGAGIRAAAVGTAAVVLAAGCSGDGGNEREPKPGPGSPNPSSTAGPLQVQRVELQSGPARLELLALGRTDGGRVTAHFRLVSETRPQGYFGSSFTYLDDKGFDIGGISLVDAVGNKLYFPLRTTTGECLCTTFEPGRLPESGSVDLYAVYPAPPDEVKSVTVRAPLTTPFHDVALASGPAVEASALPVDPATADLAAPVIRPLVSHAEGLEQSTDEEGEDKRVRISADVLFAVDKADLGPAAQRILKNVAGQIDASSDDVVEVDGHTDDTGTPQHNQDLSRRRAEAVVKALEGLVTRTGVKFQARGHGETDPVAPNGSAEGRRLNRRVAVAFLRPAPARPSAPPAAPGSGAFQESSPPPVVGTLRPKAPAGAVAPVPEVETLQYDVNAVHRDSAGLVSLVWSVTNKGSGEINLNASFSAWLTDRYKIVSTSGVSLVDPAAKVRYGPLRDDAGVCLCFQGNLSGNYSLAPGEKVTYGSLYKLPADLETVDVEIPFYSSASTIENLRVD